MTKKELDVKIERAAKYPITTWREGFIAGLLEARGFNSYEAWKVATAKKAGRGIATKGNRV